MEKSNDRFDKHRTKLSFYAMKEPRGITLIVLIITIVVLLVLAGITVANITGGDGILEQASNKKEEAEIQEEKKIISIAVSQAIEINKWNELVLTNLQEQLVGKGAKVYKLGDEFKVIFDSNRIYTLDIDGTIIDVLTNFKAPERKLSTQITDSSYGTEQNQYQISCIEDLVDLSFKVNGIIVQENGTLEYTTTRNQFSNKSFIVTDDLDFKSITSYEDFSRKDYGDINGNGTAESLLIELTTGTGWIPIGGNIAFCGNFNGNNKKISNLFINNKNETSSTAFFGGIYNSTIEDLKINGNIYCNSVNAAGVVTCSVNGIKNIINCSFEGTIENIRETNNFTAGVVAESGKNCTIDRCSCKGIIKGKSNVGGIVAKCSNDLIISNCYNESDVSKGTTVGGIAADGGESKISNCYNTGTIQGIGSNYHGAGGILGYRWSRN